MKLLRDALLSLTVNIGLEDVRVNNLLETAVRYRKVRGMVPELYHISLDGNLGSKLYPRDPDGYSEDTGPHEGDPLEEPAYPRVSFSPTVVTCFMAVYPNVKHLFKEENYPHLDFYLYKARPTKDNLLVLPEDLTRIRFVHDAHVTLEHVFLNPIQIDLVGKVRIKNTEELSEELYLPFDSDVYTGKHYVMRIPEKFIKHL